MLDYLFALGIILAIAPCFALLTSDYDKFVDRCTNIMIAQFAVALVFALVGIGVLLGGK